MYEFVILALGGLVAAKSVDLVRHLAKEVERLGVLLLWFAAGVGFAYLVDFSIFSAWGVGARSSAIGTLVTGLMVGAFAAVWHEVLGLVREFTHRYQGEASEIEARLHRAA
jgi:hypothetical protein